MLHIALVAAILPVAVAVDLKGFTAVRTLVFVDGFPLHYIKVGIPPFIPAGIGAETFLLSAVSLHHRLSAALTDGLLSGRHISCFLHRQIISAAEGFTFESIKLAIVALGPKFENTQSLYSPALISSSSDVTI